ncbi:MAG: hypothetical protein CMB82_04960 [Flammeovirgaceae bacterium]|nr:hypothetical protein [Flammeovirgaceae bacterium]
MVGIIFSISILIFVFDEKLPDPEGTQKGLWLAEKMSKAMNKSAYDSLSFISWQYGSHHYDWNKKEDSVKVIWANFEVNVSTRTLEGIAYRGGVILSDDQNKKSVEKAIRYFNNDSFWLVAPYKIYDPGVILYSVSLPLGHGLMVTHTQGGSTPGDSYLWLLDDNYFPRAWKMWVNILPVGGVKSEWMGWQKKKGAWFPGSFETLFFYKKEVKNLVVY